MVQQEFTCDELWDLRGSKRILSSSTFRLEFPSNKLRDWTGFLKKGRFIGEFGGSGDIYEGTWTNLELPADRSAPVVVAKVIQPHNLIRDPVRAKKMIKREVQVWLSLQQRLQHPNILPFVGVSYDFSEQDRDIPLLISIYMPNGSLRTYSKRHPDFDFHPLLVDIARGLDYLHNFVPGIVHGDLKASNILVTPQLRLCICDFGISRMLTEDTLWATSSVRAPGSINWMAPELLVGTQATVTKESDIYALAMTIIEIFSRDAPFTSLNEYAITSTVAILDQRPPRPPQLADRLWELIQQCWQKDPSQRLGIWEVLKVLESFEPSHGGFIMPHALPPDLQGDKQDSNVQDRLTDDFEFKGIPKLEGEVELDYKVAVGGVVEVFCGHWENPINCCSTQVAVKMFHRHRWLERDKSFSCRVQREIHVWHKLNHENILPLLGLSQKNGLPIAISPWMENGTIWDYLTNHGQSNLTALLLQIAKGMKYLHEYDPIVVHGDLKPTNILVDSCGVVKIADFGVTRMLEETALWMTTSDSALGTLRFMAPELITGDAPRVTVESDLYAYGMTALGIVSYQIPFSQYYNDSKVMFAIVARDERPPRPPNMKDWLWTLITQCWVRDPAQRPTMCQVVSRIQRVQQHLAELMNELMI